MNEVVLEVNGIIDHWGFQKSHIRYFLDKNKGSAIRCKINSWGGSVNEALAISKMFEEHGNVTVEFIGFCASAVTWMAFGAKTREMHEDSLWLCHKASIRVDVYGQMNTDQIEQTIKQLENEKKNQEAIDLIIAKKYLDMCSNKEKTVNDIFELMKQERWLNADEVKEWGFIDKIIPGINKVTNEYRKLMVDNCASLKYPVPVFEALENESPIEVQPSNDIVERIVNSVKAIFRPKEKEEPSTNSNINAIMNKTFVMVNALLGVEGLTENNGKVELTIDQIQTICNALKEAGENKKTVEDATKAIDGISENVKAISGLSNKIQAVAAVINMVPSGVPAGNGVPAKEAEDYSEIAKDPVNEFINER